MEAKDRIISEDEKLICSLIGTYPFKDVRDVIAEACLHQDEASYKAGIREVVEWIERARRQKVPKYQLKKWGLNEAV